MKSKYFREYFCSFSSKSYYFYILGVSHLNQCVHVYYYDIVTVHVYSNHCMYMYLYACINFDNYCVFMSLATGDQQDKLTLPWSPILMYKVSSSSIRSFLVPSGNKPLPEPMLTPDLCCQYGIMRPTWLIQQLLVLQTASHLFRPVLPAIVNYINSSDARDRIFRLWGSIQCSQYHACWCPGS